MTRLAHASGALLFLDGYQDSGTRPIDVKAMNVDFYVTGTLKYLLGPPGLAFLYVRRSLTERLVPSMTSWMAQREVFAFNNRKLDPAPTARRFEGGSPPIPEYLRRSAGIESALPDWTRQRRRTSRKTDSRVSGGRGQPGDSNQDPGR